MITLVYSYYDNGGMLDRHFQEWENYALNVKKDMRAIIVDDGSPNDAAINHMRDPGFPVELYRIKQNIPWNVPGARNLGMHFAPLGFSLLTDIDHLLTAEQAERLLAMNLKSGPDVLRIAVRDSNFDRPAKDFFFTFSRRWADGRLLHPHSNSYLIDPALYWKAGGCDEDFSGHWGADEQGFRRRLTSIGIPGNFDDIYLTHFGRDDIPDASTREWGRRDSKWDWKNNPKLIEKVKLGTRPENPLRFDWERLV